MLDLVEDLVHLGGVDDEVGVHEAKTNLSALLRRVAAGEEITINSGGKPVAKLVSVQRGPTTCWTSSDDEAVARHPGVVVATGLAGAAERRVHGLVEHPRTELLLSAASSWEMSVRYALGTLPLPAPPAIYVPDRMRSNGVRGLPVTHRHALHVATLPAHHRDPFDRLLIAQAQLDKLTILTADRTFGRYDVATRRAD